MSRLSASDLFAGAGSLSVGLRRSGFCIAASIELDPDAASSSTAHGCTSCATTA